MYSDEVFVTTADLDASRLPSSQDTSLKRLLENSALMRTLGVIYVLGAFILYTGLDFARDWMGNLTGLGRTNLTESAGVAFLITIPFFVISLGVALYQQQQQGVLFFRNIKFVSQIIQIVFLTFFVTALYLLALNLQSNLPPELQVNFNVLKRDFSVEVSEGPDYNDSWGLVDDVPILKDWTAQNKVGRALFAGLINTLRIIIVGIMLATLVGILLGIGLLSNNWLVQTVSRSYVEFFRNTPLLVQLVFLAGLFSAVFPVLQIDAIKIPGPVYFSIQGGMNYPKLLFQETFIFFLIPFLFGMGGGVYLWRWRLQVQDQTGQPARTLRWFLMAAAAGFVVGFMIATVAGNIPMEIEAPRLDDNERPSLRKFATGGRFSFAFLVVLAGLVMYTSAFIADIVRAGIISVPKGQIEAARAAGLTNSQTLRLIVLPQAMRLIIPPLTNQYLNLTKNSSLGIAVGFWDLFNVSRVIDNQTGQSVAIFIVIMLTYLSLSLIISFFMNLLNRSLQLKTR